MDQLNNLDLNKDNYLDFSLSEIQSIISRILLNINSLDESKIDIFYRCVDQLYILDAEIFNGGFDQYFLNQEDCYDFAKLGLIMIGADYHLSILEGAFKKYDELYISMGQERIIELDYFDTLWEEAEGLYEKRLAFLIKNIDKFFKDFLLKSHPELQL